MIPVFYHPDEKVCREVLTACYDGGVRAFEFTNRGNNAMTVFKSLRAFVSDNYPDLLLGTGTILDATAAKEFIAAGADFIVSPILKKEIADIAIESGKYWIPGCATLTEIALAEEWGADLIKLFPGSVLGSGFVSAVLGPMPWLKLMPTGGVETDEESLKGWFDAGVTCVGLGSQLLKKKLIEERDYTVLTNDIKRIMAYIQKIRK